MSLTAHIADGFVRVGEEFHAVAYKGHNETISGLWNFATAPTILGNSIWHAGNLVNPVTGNTTPFATNALIKATGTGNQVAASGVIVDGGDNITATSFIKSGGLSTQFLKADGSVDWNTYAPASGSANYVQVSPASAQSGNVWMSGTITIGNAATVGQKIECISDYNSGIKIINTKTDNPDVRNFSINSDILEYGDFAIRKSTNQGGVADINLIYFASNRAATFASTIQATTAKLTNLTDGYIPYHISDVSGLGNSPIYTDGTNVGIGTTAPNAKLEISAGINSGDNTAISFIRTNGFGNTDFQQYYTVTGNNPYGTYVKVGTTELLRLEKDAIGGAVRTIIANGNVGIGYSSGTEITNNKLAVNGSGYFNTNLTVNGLAGTGTRLVTASSTGQLGAISGGTSGQFLKTNGAGAYSFTDILNNDIIDAPWVIDIDNNLTLSSGIGSISLNNTVAQAKIQINNTGEGLGLSVDNQSSGGGVFVGNPSTGVAFSIGNYGSGSGLDIFNSGTGIPFKITTGEGGSTILASFDRYGNLVCNSGIFKSSVTPAIILNGASSAPTGIEGGIYYNSTTKHFYGYDGTTWKQLD